MFTLTIIRSDCGIFGLDDYNFHADFLEFETLTKVQSFVKAHREHVSTATNERIHYVIEERRGE